MLSSLSSEQIADFKQFGDRVSRDSSFINTISRDSQEARDMASRLTTTATRSERAEASLAERTALSDRMTSAYERGETISIDIAQDPHNLAMFTRYAEQYGGNSSAAHTLMAAELARQSLKPNRVFSDGTALPTSFEDIHHRYSQDKNDNALSPAIDDRHRANDRQVSRFGHATGEAQPAPEPSPTRQQVQARGTAIRTSAKAGQTDFDAKAEIIKTEDGTLASKRSLLKQSGVQVLKDAEATIDTAAGVVKDLLKK